jgi:hypothetical protein
MATLPYFSLKFMVIFSHLNKKKFPLHTRNLIMFLVMLVQEFAPQKQEKTLLPSDDHPYQDGAKLYINLA